MMPFNFALEANNLGQILDFVLALLIVELGLVLAIGVESKSTFVFRECTPIISLSVDFPS
jgi:metal-sulfur cluster biosynthetic enzyme